MATHKSAEKRDRQNEKRRERNVAVRSRVKTEIKGILKSVEEKNMQESQDKLLKAVKVIEKAAAKGVLHKNNASRKISRLTKKVNALS